MLTQKPALIDRMAQSPFFIIMCQFGDICLSMIKTYSTSKGLFLSSLTLLITM